jgi:hypothetical protein
MNRIEKSVTSIQFVQWEFDYLAGLFALATTIINLLLQIKRL